MNKKHNTNRVTINLTLAGEPVGNVLVFHQNVGHFIDSAQTVGEEPARN